jgi:hypothetical protein
MNLISQQKQREYFEVKIQNYDFEIENLQKKTERLKDYKVNEKQVLKNYYDNLQNQVLQLRELVDMRQSQINAKVEEIGKF